MKTRITLIIREETKNYLRRREKSEKMKEDDSSCMSSFLKLLVTEALGTKNNLVWMTQKVLTEKNQ